MCSSDFLLVDVSVFVCVMCSFEDTVFPLFGNGVLSVSVGLGTSVDRPIPYQGKEMCMNVQKIRELNDYQYVQQALTMKYMRYSYTP